MPSQDFLRQLEALKAKSAAQTPTAVNNAASTVADASPNPPPAAPPLPPGQPVQAPPAGPGFQAIPPSIQRGAEGVVHGLQQNYVDPAVRLATGQTQGALGTAGDVMSVGATVAGAAALAFGQPEIGLPLLAGGRTGTLVHGIAEALGASMDTSAMFDGILSAAAGLKQLGNTTAAGMRAARGLLNLGKGVGQAAEAGISAMEAEGKTAMNLAGEITGSMTGRSSAETGMMRAGRSIRQSAIGQLLQRRAPLSKAIDGIENEAKLLTVKPGSPAYDGAKAIVAEADRRYVSNPTIERIRGSIARGEEIPGGYLTRLRRELMDKGNISGTVNPNQPVAGLHARAIRNLATDTIKEVLPPDLAGHYTEALNSYNTHYAEPARLVRAVTSRSTSPATAFELAFSSKNPSVLSTLTELAQENPGIRSKMRLGFLEHLRISAGQDFEQPEAALKILKSQKARDVMLSGGLFSPDELRTLEYTFKGDTLRQVTANLAAAIKPGKNLPFEIGRGALRGAALGAGGSYLTHAISGQLALGSAPVLIAAIAGGAAPAIRRLSLVAPGTPAAMAAGAEVVKAIGNLAGHIGAQPKADDLNYDSPTN